MAELVERYSTTIDIYSNRPAPTPRLSTAYLCFKIILLIANLIFMVFACVLIGVGSYALNTKANGDLVGQTLPAGLIAMGVFMMLLAAMGAISAWKESVVGLGFYLAFMVVITIILFAIGVAIAVKRNDAGEYIASAWYEAPRDAKEALQKELECCGLKYFNESSAWPCPAGFDNPATTGGCYDPLVSTFETAYQHAGGTGIAFSVLMGGGIFLVACLIQGIRRHQHEKNLNTIRATHAGADLGADGLGGHAGVGVADELGARVAGELVDLSGVDAGAASMFDRAEPHPHEEEAATAQHVAQPQPKGKRRR